VIGDPIGIILWDKGAVTASSFSAHLVLPALAAWIIPTVLINRQLPHRMEIEWVAPPYRGDDTRLNRWQRYLMLLIGIGGLWFIPTFHDITRLPPFLGALCLLSVLWVFNEAFNRKLIQADQMAQHRIPRALQYGAMQQILFVMGIMLAMGVMTETGVMDNIASWVFDTLGGNVWVVGTLLGVLSSVVDTFTIAVTSVSFFPVDEGYFGFNGLYWQVIAYTTAVGGSMLLVGSVSGLALMRMEHIRMGWFLKAVTPKVLLGFVVGLLVLYLQTALH
jgi:Na+/H+ antiporter NhaD/arsenite permease-like protein